MSEIDDIVDEAIDKFKKAAAIAHSVSNGPVGSYTETESGPVPSLLELQNQFIEQLGDLPSIQESVDILEDFRVGVSVSGQNLIDADKVSANGKTITSLIDKRVVSPEQYPVSGPVGVGNKAADTAAFKAAALAMRDGDTFKARGEYLVDGSQVVFPALFNWTLDLRGAILRQQSNFSKTITINNPLALTVKGGRFFGRGGAAGEFSGASSSYNGVAAIAVFGGDEVVFDGVYGREHAGGFLACFGVIRQTFRNIDDKGIGAPFIDPVGQGNQGNGSDFSIMCQPTDNSLGWIYEYRFSGCRLRDHAFGVQAVQSKVVLWENMDVGPCPGQHGFYGIELDNVQFGGTNIFRGCYQGGFKNQYENYAGRFIGPEWQANTQYNVGQNVRAFSILWKCRTAHVSGASFSSTNWDVDSRFQRTGLHLSGITFQDCGYDILLVSTTESDGREIYSVSPMISNIKSTGCVNGWSLDRATDAVITDVDIEGGIRGIFARDFSGTLRDITIRKTKKNGIALSQYGNTFYENVKLIDCGLEGVGDDERAPLLVFAPTAQGIPSQLAAPYTRADDVGFIFSTGDAAGAYLLYDADTRNRWEIDRIFGTPTTKKLRIDGSVIGSEKINGPGFVSGAQNNPATFAFGEGGRDFHGSQNPQQAGSTRPFMVGDRCWNTATTASGVLGWVCTTAGSPGTWVKMAANQAN